MPFSDGDAISFPAQPPAPSDSFDDDLFPRVDHVAPRTVLSADAQNPSELDHFSSLPAADRKAMRYILRGEYDRIGKAEEDGAPDDQDEDYPDEDAKGAELGPRFQEGTEQLQRFGLVEQSLSRTHMGRLRSALAFLPRKAATAMTIVFNGNQPMLAVPTPLLSRFETHLLLSRDPKRCFGLAGLPGLGDDYEACVSNLRTFLDHLGVQKLFCLGISAGGVSALKFGVDLHAHGVLCFSGPTTLNLDDDPGAKLSDYPQLTQLYRIDRGLGIDLADYYRCAARRPGLLMVFGSGHPRDSWLAERVGDVKGAELAEVQGLSGHKTYPWATQHGFMPMLLERMFALSPVTR